MNVPAGSNISPTPLSVAQAKDRILAWGEAGDARAAEIRSNAVTGLERIAAGGVIAAVALMIIRRLLPAGSSRAAAPAPHTVASQARAGAISPRPARWLSWILIARAGRLLLPHAINAASNWRAARAKVHRPGADPA
jgi:hypothetical protein